MSQYAAGHIGGVIPCSRVELHVSATKLLDLDTFSKSDPCCVVYLKEAGRLKEIFKTETIQDNLNPHWVKGLTMDYYFESVQTLLFRVYDIDNPRANWDQQDFIGELEVTLADILSHGGSLTRSLNNPRVRRHPGYLSIHCEEIGDLKTTAAFHLAGVKLDKKDLFGKSDGFLRISKMNENGQFVAIHQTEVIKKNLNPRWAPFVIPMSTLNSGDPTRPIKFECIDWNKSGKEDPIGSFVASFQELQGRTDWPLINPKRQSKRSYVNSGIIKIISLKAIKEHSFLEFIQGGLDMNLMISIDYTASNGVPTSPASLHHQRAGRHTEYAEAIAAVGSILMHYDTDQMYPVYGFGAKIGRARKVSHCFPLNQLVGVAQDEVHTIDGVLQAYYQSLNLVQLYGPTNFAPTISKAAAEALEMHQNQYRGQQYLILLILTDGEITDMDKTIAEIVSASALPLSIVIVGVGSADFSKMDILDADDNPLVSRGRTMARDIVQFTPFREFRNDPALLSREVLHELPEQVTSYFKAAGVKPNPPQIRPMQGQSSAQYPTTGQQYQTPPSSGQGGQPAPPNQGFAPPRSSAGPPPNQPQYHQAAPQPAYTQQQQPGRGPPQQQQQWGASAPSYNPYAQAPNAPAYAGGPGGPQQPRQNPYAAPPTTPYAMPPQHYNN